MAPECSHCKEHEPWTTKLTETVGRVDNIETNADLRSRQMTIQAGNIERTLTGKLGASTFYRTMSVLVLVTIAAIGANWKVMYDIDTKVDNFTVNPAVIAKHLDIDLPK